MNKPTIELNNRIVKRRMTESEKKRIVSEQVAQAKIMQSYHEQLIKALRSDVKQESLPNDNNPVLKLRELIPLEDIESEPQQLETNTVKESLIELNDNQVSEQHTDLDINHLPVYWNEKREQKQNIKSRQPLSMLEETKS
jgi:hypothetical protein